MKAPFTIAIAALAFSVAGAGAGEEKFKLKPDPGADKVRANCVSCHSLDYIASNSPFLDRKGWDAVVTKMIKAFGAPIKPEDTAEIAEYLDKHYGKR
jgi:sulfite dehydrogenase (cytochrome) subunit B